MRSVQDHYTTAEGPHTCSHYVEVRERVVSSISFVSSVMLTLLAGVRQTPSLLWLVDYSDEWLSALCLAGVTLSAIAMLGCATMPIMLALWVLYMSLTNVGQLFYGSYCQHVLCAFNLSRLRPERVSSSGYGWEIQLLETGFLAIWLCPVWSTDPLPRHTPPTFVLMLLLRWLIFRIMLGAVRSPSCMAQRQREAYQSDDTRRG
jgi:hypothetical protein